MNQRHRTDSAETAIEELVGNGEKGFVVACLPVIPVQFASVTLGHAVSSPGLP